MQPVDPISRHGEWERDTTFRRALVRGAARALVEIDWAADSAFRFFPIERDLQPGWRLHLFDAATNKALTLAARTETRAKAGTDRHGKERQTPMSRSAAPLPPRRGCSLPPHARARLWHQRLAHERD
ncbi:MAG: hypothetical protein WEB50_14750 [Vicinamibacterales bacterium]